jgi:hypothetical protein
MAFKNDSDAAHLLVNTLDLILSITSLVYDAVASSLEVTGEEYNKDMFTLCTLAIDNGIIDTVSILLGISATVSEAKLILDASGNITLKGASITDVAAMSHAEVHTPTPAIEQAGLVMKGVSKIADATKFFMKVGFSIYNFVVDANKENDPEEL